MEEAFSIEDREEDQYQYAIIENNTVVSLLSIGMRNNNDLTANQEAQKNVSENQSIINVTGKTYFNNKVVIKSTWSESEQMFYPPNNKSGWVFSTASSSWVAPIQKPSGSHIWDNETESWLDISSYSGNST